MSTIYEKAIKLLKIRPHHSGELTRKLMMRGFDRESVADVISKLQEANLIDNEKYAQMYMDELIRNKTFGFYGFKSKLMQRGIASNEAEKLLKDNLSLEQETEIARKLIRGEGSGTREEKNKFAQKLQRKGFRGEVIRQVISNK